MGDATQMITTQVETRGDKEEAKSRHHQHQHQLVTHGCLEMFFNKFIVEQKRSGEMKRDLYAQ